MCVQLHFHLTAESKELHLIWKGVLHKYARIPVDICIPNQNPWIQSLCVRGW